MKDKKILLVAINSKYIHSNLAVYCLKAAATPHDNLVHIKEYSINNQLKEILRWIYEEKPDVIGFSCYIWNISYVTGLIKELAKILPKVHIWLGGPEVSYNAGDYVCNYPFIKGVMKGEGEEIFRRLVECYANDDMDAIAGIDGITMKYNGEIIDNSFMPPMAQLSQVPYDIDALENRIIYYESSRGCPFSCSYCLSSIDKKLRFKNLDMVKQDLDMFIAHEVKQVKFIDRTFNAKKEHAYAIWRHIMENDRGITNFHFEVAADLLDDEGIEILNAMRPGLVQLEVGVQSTNEATIEAINRKMNIDKVRDVVARVHSKGNVHMHLDLIAGLPYEDLFSFAKSFDDIYYMKPEQLQLGFLKVLHGSPMEKSAAEYGIVAESEPPYEVLYTKWLNFDDVLLLKLVENVVEMFYNSGMFKTSLNYLEKHFESPFEMYRLLGEFYDIKYPIGSLPSRNGKYELVYEFFTQFEQIDERCLVEFLKYDMLCRDNLKSLPYFIKQDNENAIRARKLCSGRKMTKAEHIEIFKIDIQKYIDSGVIQEGEYPMHFDYLNRDALTNNATIITITEMENENERRTGNN